MQSYSEIVSLQMQHRIRVGPKSNHKCPSETEKDMQRHTGRGPCDAGDRTGVMSQAKEAPEAG